MVAFIESIQVETLRAQNTGKIGPGDDNGSSSNLATLAGLVVVLFSKTYLKISEVKRITTLLLTDETLRKMAPLTVRNHIDARRDDGELHSLFDRVLPLPWGAGAWAAVKARPVHRRRRRRRHYLHCHDAHH